MGAKLEYVVGESHTVHCPLRFKPSRVEGLPAVSQVTVWTDRIELISEDRLVVYRFFDMARWPHPRWLWKMAFRKGIKPKFLPVGDRDWFHAPPDMFFIFYTTPRLKVFMPEDEI